MRKSFRDPRAWEPDTEMGGAQQRFPVTRHSAVVASASSDREVRRRAFAALVAAYWKPVYKYARLRWKLASEDAKEATQGFFARALEKDLFARFDPAKASFRTYLRTCFDGYVKNERTAAGREKRGGAVLHTSLDFDAAEGELDLQEPAAPGDLERAFHQEWVRSLFGLAVAELERSCRAAGKDAHFALFERYDLRDEPGEGVRPSYASLAAELGLTVTAVTNHLAFARAEFRRIALELLRESCGSEAEFEEEARALFGVAPR